MKVNGSGFYTDIKQDISKSVGVLEKYNIGEYKYTSDKTKTKREEYLYRGLFTMDNKFNIVKPTFINGDKSFEPLSNIIDSTEESINRFRRSHKGAFAVLGSFVFVVEAKLNYDKRTKELVKDEINLFIPSQVLNDEYILLLKCSEHDSFNTRKTNPLIIENCRRKVLSYLTYETIIDKNTYIRKRISES